MTNLFEYLKERAYPGRGIMLGKNPEGKSVCAYFIMGRSVNSRNRVFETTEDGIRTKAFDESQMVDPSLIIYHPVRRVKNYFVVTNGDQTDTIRDDLVSGRTWLDALCSRRFEPDEPNWTPRISGIEFPCGGYLLSILKSQNGNPACCERFFYSYDEPQAGMGHFISTYEGFGSPLPSFHGDPVAVEVPALNAAELADQIWNALDNDNKVSLYVCVDGDEVILNKNC
ncbi:MAG: IMP cyclohydrolase [bacterium]|nr:IMP cyclohydrolase [bacterium]